MEKQFLSKTLMILTSVIIITVKTIFSQPDTVWTKTFGGSDFEVGYCVRQTSDGGYILTGYTNSYGAGNYDVWLIKTNSCGDTIWTKTFGGNRYDVAYSVQQTSDGGYILTGNTKSYNGTNVNDVWLIKTDINGNMKWEKNYRSSKSGYLGSVQQTFDGGYIIGGTTDYYSGNGKSDMWLIKTDANGNEEWYNTFGGSNGELGYSAKQTVDGGYITVGYTGLFGSIGDSAAWPQSFLDDVLLIKTDSSGIISWAKTYGEKGDEVGRSVQQTLDGGYIITGNTNSYGAGHSDVWLIKTDVSGDTIWTKTFGGDDTDLGHSVQQTFDGGYIIAGFTKSFGAGNKDVWIIRTDEFGNVNWTKTFGGSGNDEGCFVQQTFDGGFIITGYTYCYSSGYADVWLIKLGSDTGVEEGKDKIPEAISVYQNYPNPFNLTTTISYQLIKSSFVKLTIFDINGRLVETLVNEKKNAGYYSVEWNAENVSSGIYLYRINTKEFINVKKCLFIK